MRAPSTTLVLTILICACQSGPGRLDQADMDDQATLEHGDLIRTRTVNGIRTTVRLMPNASSVKDGSDHGREQYITEGEQLGFIVNMVPDGEHRKGDLMYTGIHDEASFKEQAVHLNFSWQQHAELKCGGSRYEPVLGTLENTYGLTPDRNIVLVFAPMEHKDDAFHHSEFIELILHDRFFGTGSQHFTFRRKDLEKALIPTT